MADFAAERAASSRKSSPAVLDNRSAAATSRARGQEAAAAASRARGAQRAGFVKGATKPAHHDAGTNRIREQVEEGHRAMSKSEAPTGGAAHRTFKLPQDRAERNRVVLDAIRSTPSHEAAGRLLGCSGARVAQIIGELRRAGELPEDVVALLRARANHKPLEASAKPAHIVSADLPTATGHASPRRVEPKDIPLGDGPGEPFHHPAPTSRPDVVLPCDGCAHAVVCAFRPDLEAFVAPVVELPHASRGVFEIQAIAIGCAFRLEAVS